MSKILWTSTPPPKPLRSDIGLIAIEAGEEVKVRLLGPAWWASCHWVEPRSIVCRGAESCPVHSYPVNEKGFICVQAENRNWRGKQNGLFLGVLCLTPEVGEDVGACKIGDVCFVSRPPGNKRSPLCWARDQRVCKAPLPEGFDPRPFVERAMSWNKKGACKPRLLA